MKENFKIGDRVICIDDSLGQVSHLKTLVKNQIYTVKEIRRYSEGIAFEEVNAPQPSSGYYTPSRFKRYQEEFKLPEKWMVIYQNREEFDIINNHFNKNWGYRPVVGLCGYFTPNRNAGNNWITNYKTSNNNIEGLSRDSYVQITFDQFNEFVRNIKPVKTFEPLPYYQIIKTSPIATDKAIEVINNEGSTFEIGDEVSMIKGSNMMLRTSAKIIRFRKNKAKTDICAVFDEKYPNGVSISKLQHYIKPKVVEIPTFTLPEKWYVKVTNDSIEVLSQWRFEQSYPTNKLRTNHIVGMCSGVFDNGRIHKGHTPLNYTESFGQEITFEQFNQYVLGIQPVVEPIKEETILEKVQRLYPIGTRLRSLANTIGVSNGIVTDGGRQGVFVGRADNGVGRLFIYDPSHPDQFATIINN